MRRPIGFYIWAFLFLFTINDLSHSALSDTCVYAGDSTFMSHGPDIDVLEFGVGNVINSLQNGLLPNIFC